MTTEQAPSPEEIDHMAEALRIVRDLITKHPGSERDTAAAIMVYAAHQLEKNGHCPHCALRRGLEAVDGFIEERATRPIQ